MEILRATLEDIGAADALLQEYYAAINVQKRDTPEELHAYLGGEGAGFWIADVEGVRAGCVGLRPLPASLRAAECKRLYVRPEFRGLGLASALLTALERQATINGYEWLYLDSSADLRAALRLYAQRGYEPCERYNNNPQATVFLRKHLPTTSLAVPEQQRV